MNIDDIKTKWLADKAGILDEDDLRELPDGFEHLKDDKDHRWYSCPCGGDHAAMRCWIKERLSKYLSPVLTCFVTNQQWLIRPVDIVETIKKEEEAYFRLLDRAPKIVRKVIARRVVSEETLQFLNDTHGIDKDLAISILHDQRKD